MNKSDKLIAVGFCILFYIIGFFAGSVHQKKQMSKEASSLVIERPLPIGKDSAVMK